MRELRRRSRTSSGRFTRFEARLAELGERLGDPALYANGERVREATAERKRAEEWQVMRLMREWEQPRRRSATLMRASTSLSDPATLRRERAGARELRASQWWKRRIADGVCYYCRRVVGHRALTMDHVVPLARGGRSTRAMSLRPARSATPGRSRWSR